MGKKKNADNGGSKLEYVNIVPNKEDEERKSFEETVGELNKGDKSLNDLGIGFFEEKNARSSEPSELASVNEEPLQIGTNDLSYGTRIRLFITNLWFSVCSFMRACWQTLLTLCCCCVSTNHKYGLASHDSDGKSEEEVELFKEELNSDGLIEGKPAEPMHKEFCICCLDPQELFPVEWFPFSSKSKMM